MSKFKMDYLINVLILFESVYIYQAVECQIEYCQICTHSQECSVCALGRFGQKCEYECRVASSCSFCRDVDLKTFKSDAECFGCKKHEYFSKGECFHCPPTCVSCVDANNCSECYDGYFELTCSDVCPENCQQCSSQHLCFSCKEGWSGRICQCSSNCIQDGNQYDWCSINGTCLKGCVSGKQGIRCDADCPKKEICLKCDQFDERCLQCSDGLYGSLNNCDKTCGHCKPNNEGYIKCDVDTGECNDACVDGYYGRRCDQKCARCLPDEAGVVQCDTDTGNCGNGCVDGFYGNRCDRNCDDCVSNSPDVVNCTTEMGECNVPCVDGLYGRFCKKKCRGNCFDHSTKSNGCDKISGNCIFGCIHGWCGEMCEIRCSTTCLDKSCDQVSGKCNNGCVLGWFGDTCQEACSNTCFNGTCTDDSAFCIYGCVPGWYGATCKGTCNSMCFNRSCDQQSGHCYYGCVSRFYGDTCEYRCSDNCKKGVCDRHTAQCSSGCESGFEGLFCNVTQSLEAHLSPVLIGIISVVAAVVIVFGCVLLTWLQIRLRIKKYRGLRRTTRENTVSRYDEIDDDMLERTFTGDNLRQKCDISFQNTSDSSSRLNIERIYDLPVERGMTSQANTVLTSTFDNSHMRLEFPVVNIYNPVHKTENANDDYEIPVRAKHKITGSTTNDTNICCGNEDLSLFSVFNSSENLCVEENNFTEQVQIPDAKEYLEFECVANNKPDRQNTSENFRKAKSHENISNVDRSLDQTSSLSEQDIRKTKLQEPTNFETECNSCNYLHPIS